MTLSEAITHRDAAKAAYLTALEARAVGFGDKSVSRQDITDLRHEYDNWERVVANLQRIGIFPQAAIAHWTR